MNDTDRTVTQDTERPIPLRGRRYPVPPAARRTKAPARTGSTARQALDVPGGAGAAVRHVTQHKLTERRKQVLRFLHDYSQRNGWAASYNEIGAQFGITWKVAKNDLQALQKLDFIEYAGNRCIKVLRLP